MLAAAYWARRALRSGVPIGVLENELEIPSARGLGRELRMFTGPGGEVMVGKSVKASRREVSVFDHVGNFGSCTLPHLDFHKRLTIIY
jgi:hypothetical protein